MANRAADKIPVLMYHGIADNIYQVPYSYLLQPSYQFERCMRYLSDKRFITISLHDLYSHVKFNKAIPRNSIVLTFDDGYLDNWVFVYPILKKYNMKATIFISPDFVDPSTIYRPNLDDVRKGSIARKDLRWGGYLSWNEMQKMMGGGVIDIQSHTMTHTWHFKSNQIVDFHHFGDQYHWLQWNHHPERKYAWLDGLGKETLRYGTPVYEYGRSLAVRRFHEDSLLDDYLADFVVDRGGECFFLQHNWRDILYKEVERYRKIHLDRGEYESKEEGEKRVEFEILGAKQIIEKNLQKSIDFLCWPGGAYTPEAYELALRVGHLATTKAINKNEYGNDPTRIHRIAGYLDSRKYNPLLLRNFFLPFFILQIKRYQGNQYYEIIFKSIQLLLKKARTISKSL